VPARQFGDADLLSLKAGEAKKVAWKLIGMESEKWLAAMVGATVGF
jgi:hypothetical protein